MTDVAPGQRIDDFEMLEVAGRGGMGVVFRARQVSVDRIVAFKLIGAAIFADPGYLARFEREARVAAAVEHPNVVSVYGAGRYRERPYIAMQWIDGTDLRSVIDDHGPMEPERACSIAAQLASALDAVHDRGLLHRDLKPANVLLRRIKRRDHVYLTDFGIAKFVQTETAPLTQAGQFVGTPGYIAPECLRGDEVDRRSDVYSLGCMLFEFLAGERPFAATNEIALYWSHANDPRPALSERRPHVGERFDAVLARAMAIKPHERYSTATELAEALQGALETGSRRVPPPPEPATPAPPPPAPITPVSAPETADPTPSAPAPTPPAPVTPVSAPEPVAPAPPPRTRTAATRRQPPAAPPPAAPARRGGLSPAARRILVAAAVGGVMVALLVALDPFSGSGGGSSDENGTDARADVISVLHGYERAFRAPGVFALRPLLTPDVTRLASESGECREVSGREAVLAAYADRSAARTSYALPGLSASDVELEGSDRARVTARFTVSASDTAGTTEFSLTRRPDGWRITRVAATNC